MSIFPKRTVPGSTVTIHWNFNTASLQSEHIYPFVRIGVRNPLGELKLLLEKNMLALPAVQKNLAASDGGGNRPLYLNKNLPLLILADYLSGRHKREALVDILQNIQSGRHYFFTYTVPPDAPPGRYELLSEVHSNGIVRYSKTASDDFFLVEKISFETISDNELELHNASPEDTPVKIIEYTPGNALRPEDIQAFELKGLESKRIFCDTSHTFISYNEERELIPVMRGTEAAPLRNQQLLSISKETADGEVIYLLERDGEEGYTLSGTSRELWQRAQGLTAKSELRTGDRAAVYDEMIQNGLLTELQVP